MSISAKFARLLLSGSDSRAKFNREPCRKKQEPSNKAPDKILRRKIKSGSHKLAQKPDLESKFYAPLFKKAAI